MSYSYFIKGVREASGVPIIGLGLSMFTFGAYLNSSNFNLLQSFLSTFFAFALPGQFVMAETLLAGGGTIGADSSQHLPEVSELTCHKQGDIDSEPPSACKWPYLALGLAETFDRAL